MKLRIVGGAFVVTLPKALVEGLRWGTGDNLTIRIEGKNALKISRED